MSDAYYAWISFYTDEVEKIWNTESVEFRNTLMLFHVLKQEYTRFECEMISKLGQFKEEIKVRDDLCSPPLNPDSCVVSTKQAPTNKVEIIKESQLSKSPKITKNRKITRPKKSSSPSLLDVPKDNKNPPLKSSSRSLFGVIKEDKNQPSQLQADFSTSKPRNENSTEELGNQQSKIIDNDNVIDTSMIVNDTPDLSVAKKLKRSRLASLKLPRSTTSKPKEKEKVNTLTQMFTNMPMREQKQTSTVCPTFDDDETFFVSDENYQRKTAIAKAEPKKPKMPKMKDYDKIPEPKSKSPQHVHVTEPVRRKADRLKLPGWSCADCQQFYEKLNLPPEKLQEKMNACSKHRNKFKPLDDTPKGYWDISNMLTQDSTDDSIVYDY